MDKGKKVIGGVGKKVDQIKRPLIVNQMKTLMFLTKLLRNLYLYLVVVDLHNIKFILHPLFIVNTLLTH